MIRNGFTLVEVLVVMTLIGLAGAAVVMTMGSGRSDSAEAASRFASRLGAARDSAVVQGAPVSAWVSPSGYGFERLSGGDWQPIEEEPLDGADWPRGVTAAVPQSGARQRIQFDSLGLAQPATVAISGEAGTTQVRIDANGDIAVR